MRSTPEAASFWNSFFRPLLDLVYPPKCALCGRCGLPALCDECAADMVPSQAAFEIEPGLTVAGAFAYQGRAAHAVKRLKYERSTSLAQPMSEIMASAAQRLSLDSADLVVPVPIHYLRRCSRGFNQSELLCRAFPRDRIDYGALKRIRPTRPQVGLTREERSQNLEGAFRAGPQVAGKSVLLIDDVLTGGFTMLECAKALRNGGAARVQGLAFCVEGWQSRAGLVA